MRMSLQPVQLAINHHRLCRRRPRYLEESEDIGRPRTKDMAPRIQVYLSQVCAIYYSLFCVHCVIVSALIRFYFLVIKTVSSQLAADP